MHGGGVDPERLGASGCMACGSLMAGASQSDGLSPGTQELLESLVERFNQTVGYHHSLLRQELSEEFHRQVELMRTSFEIMRDGPLLVNHQKIDEAITLVEDRSHFGEVPKEKAEQRLVLSERPEKTSNSGLRRPEAAIGDIHEVRSDVDDLTKAEVYNSTPMIDKTEDEGAKSVTAFQKLLRRVKVRKTVKGVMFRHGTSLITAVEDSQATATEIVLRKFMEGACFHTTAALVVVLNSLFIGLDVDAHASDPTGFEPSVSSQVGEVIFSVFFTAELVLRQVAYGSKHCWCSSHSGWNYLDLLLTFIGWWDIATARITYLDRYNFGSFGSFRMVRLVRICTTMEFMKVPFFRSLRLLLNAMLAATRSSCWLLLLLVFVIYTFSLVFTQARADYINHEDDIGLAYQVQLDAYFGSVAKTMYSLYQAITGGVSWIEIADVLTNVGRSYELVFSGYIFYTFFIFFNVVTGVFCNIASEAAANDQAELVAKIKEDNENFVKEVQTLFRELDLAGGSDSSEDGVFTLGELQEFLKDVRVQAAFAHLEMDIDNAEVIFELFGEGGKLSLDNFMEACKKLRGGATAIDTQLIIGECSYLRQTVDELSEGLKAVTAALAGQPDHAAHGWSIHPPLSQPAHIVV